MSEGGYVAGCSNFSSQCGGGGFLSGGGSGWIGQGPVNSGNACDGIHGVCQAPPQVEDLADVFDPGVQLDNASRTLVPSEETIQNAIDTVKDVTPFLGTYRAFSRGEYLSGVLSAAGDAALAGGWLAKLARFFAGSRKAEATVSVFHGSIRDGAAILDRGFDATRTPVYVSRDIAAARDALRNHPNAIPGMGRIIESRLPGSVFRTSFAPAERAYNGFFPNLIRSTEIPVRTPEQIELLNKFMVR